MALTHWMADPAVHAVVAHGITQITAWGTTYYALGVLAAPIVEDTGWSRSIVFMGFSVALAVMSLVSTTVGRLIDRRGGQLVMSIGSLACAAGLLGMAYAQSEWTYLCAWAFLGIAMRMTLYDAAFAALVQITPSRGRRAISYLTLFGGFASSVFWPIGHYLAADLGWRTTLLIFAALNILLCLPLHWFGLARVETTPESLVDTPASVQDPTDQPLEGRSRRIGLILFAGVMSLNGFAMSALSVHLVPVLQATGIGVAAAVWLASLKGVAQVGGRILEMTLWRSMHPLTVARIALLLVPLSFVVLYMAGASFVAALTFTLLLGAGQGIVTIVRGAVPLVLFGNRGYGEVLGLIATPVLIVTALSPLVFAVIVDTFGPRAGEIVLLSCAATAAVAMELTTRWYRVVQRQRKAQT